MPPAVSRKPKPKTRSKTDPTSAKRQKLRDMLAGLRAMYGPRTHRRGGRGEGLDVLVEAMLAQNTNMANATRGYRMLRRRLPTWTKVMNAPLEDVQREITICGLARMRARRLQNLLRTIKTQTGRLSIEFLAERSNDDAYAWLTSLFGIGPKTAKCVLLFGFDKDVLPVDNGILRVVRRLRLVRPKARDIEAERTLSPAIDPGKHYETHVLLFTHAKERCRPRNPKCSECQLLELCPYGQRRVRHQRSEVEAIEQSAAAKRFLARIISGGLAKHGNQAERDEPTRTRRRNASAG